MVGVSAGAGGGAGSDPQPIAINAPNKQTRIIKGW
jgi:hypothetical protein